MKDRGFAGDKKQFDSFLKSAEAWVIKRVVPMVPKPVTSKVLTLSCIPISTGIVLSGYLAQNNINWLYLFSFLVFLHWLTDALDGAVARYRNEGEPRWGYYMDHFLDYFFMCSFVIGYALFVSPETKIWVLSLIPLMGALMVSEYLRFGAINKFNIAHFGFGIIELKAALIILNTFIILYGVGFFEKAIPYIVLFFILAIIVTVYVNQKEILKIDREIK